MSEYGLPMDPKHPATGGIPEGRSAWEHHTRELAARAIRLQVEKEAREAGRKLTDEELRRRCAVKAADVSPFLGLVNAAKAKQNKPGLLARIFGW